VADEHENPVDLAGGRAADRGLSDEHEEIAAALDVIEGDLDDVAAALARMA